MKIKSIGPILSSRIIENRPYKKIDELLNLYQIGYKRLNSIKSWIDVLNKTDFSNNKLNVNTCSKSDLLDISEIGEAKATRIIESRPISNIEDLNKIKGVGIKTMESIRIFLTV